jgi:hypothetical protein
LHAKARRGVVPCLWQCSRPERQKAIKKAEALWLAAVSTVVRCTDRAGLALGGDMKNLAALTAMAAPAAGLAPSSSTVTAAVAPKSGTETTRRRLTGLAAVAGNPAFRMTLTGPVATTVTGPRGAASANGALL